MTHYHEAGYSIVATARHHTDLKKWQPGLRVELPASGGVETIFGPADLEGLYDTEKEAIAAAYARGIAIVKERKGG